MPLALFVRCDNTHGHEDTPLYGRRRRAAASLSGIPGRASSTVPTPWCCCHTSRVSRPLLKRARLVHGGSARLLRLHQVLRLVIRGLHLAAGGLGIRGDLPLDRAHSLAPVAVPLDPVALLERLCHPPLPSLSSPSRTTRSTRARLRRRGAPERAGTRSAFRLPPPRR